MLNNHERHSLNLIARARNEKIENFTDEEIIRVFENTMIKTKNIKKFKKLIDKGLTLEMIEDCNEILLIQWLKEVKWLGLDVKNVENCNIQVVLT